MSDWPCGGHVMSENCWCEPRIVEVPGKLPLVKHQYENPDAWEPRASTPETGEDE